MKEAFKIEKKKCEIVYMLRFYRDFEDTMIVGQCMEAKFSYFINAFRVVFMAALYHMISEFSTAKYFTFNTALSLHSHGDVFFTQFPRLPDNPY